MNGPEPVILTKGIPGEPCPIAKALEVIGTKWTFLIIRDLLIEGISPKTLSLRLRELETHGILERRVYPEVPPRVEYTLTPKGIQLEGIFIELKRYGLAL